MRFAFNMQLTQIATPKFLKIGRWLKLHTKKNKKKNPPHMGGPFLLITNFGDHLCEIKVLEVFFFSYILPCTFKNSIACNQTSLNFKDKRSRFLQLHSFVNPKLRPQVPLPTSPQIIMILCCLQRRQVYSYFFSRKDVLIFFKVKVSKVISQDHGLWIGIRQISL